MAKIKLDIKTLHKTLLADAKFLEKLDPKRKEIVLTMKSAKDMKDVEDTKLKEVKK